MFPEAALPGMFTTGGRAGGETRSQRFREVHLDHREGIPSALAKEKSNDILPASNSVQPAHRGTARAAETGMAETKGRGKTGIYRRRSSSCCHER